LTWFPDLVERSTTEPDLVYPLFGKHLRTRLALVRHTLSSALADTLTGAAMLTGLAADAAPLAPNEVLPPPHDPAAVGANPSSPVPTRPADAPPSIKEERKRKGANASLRLFT
jgi:hypothetical protein